MDHLNHSFVCHFAKEKQMNWSNPLATKSQIFRPFSTSVPIMDKPGSWFLLAKCLKNTCGRVTF